MTRKQKKEALRLYFTQGLDMEGIAQRLGASLREVYAVLNDPKELKPYMERSEAAKLRALICVNEKAEEAAKKQAELIGLGEAAAPQAVSQRAAKDILDRAGISTDGEETRDIRITFEGMPKLGMPQTEGGGDDESEA